MCDCEKRIETALIASNLEHNRLRGRLYETVEAVGLPEKQEDAIKRLIRRQTYDSQGAVQAALRGEDVTSGARP